MIQKKYLCKDKKAVEDAIPQIKSIISETPHKAALVTFYEAGFSRQDIEDLIGQIRSLGFPELQVAGIAIAMVAEFLPDGLGMLLNLILTEEADIEVVGQVGRRGDLDDRGEDRRADRRSLYEH